MYKSLIATICLVSLVVLAQTVKAGNFLYAGVNEAGLEFAPQTLPGTAGTTYIGPAQSSVDYFKSSGASVIRLPFSWERLQSTPSGDLDAAYLALIDTAVQQTTSSGSTSIILDCHNYARYTMNGNTQVVTESDSLSQGFIDLWTKLAKKYGTNSKVIFGLMNEPHDLDTNSWFTLVQKTMSAIRSTGATNLILVCGNAWSGAWSWQNTNYGTANSQAATILKDSNFAFEMHQYFDSDSSGTNPECSSIATTRIADVQQTTEWLRQNNYRAFMGEFATGTSATCISYLESFMQHLSSNSDIWIGFAYWAAGQWWGTSFYNIEPSNNQITAPQWGCISKYMSGSSGSVVEQISSTFGASSTILSISTSSVVASPNSLSVSSTSFVYQVPTATITSNSGYAAPTISYAVPESSQVDNDNASTATTSEPTILVIQTTSGAVAGDMASAYPTPVATSAVAGDNNQVDNDCEETATIVQTSVAVVQTSGAVAGDMASAYPTPVVTPDVSGDNNQVDNDCEETATIVQTSVVVIQTSGAVAGDMASAYPTPVATSAVAGDNNQVDNDCEETTTIAQPSVVVIQTTGAVAGDVASAYPTPVATSAVAGDNDQVDNECEETTTIAQPSVIVIQTTGAVAGDVASAYPTPVVTPDVAGDNDQVDDDCEETPTIAQPSVVVIQTTGAVAGDVASAYPTPAASYAAYGNDDQVDGDSASPTPSSIYVATQTQSLNTNRQCRWVCDEL